MSEGAAVSLARRRSALVRALGPEIAAAIADPHIVEALINADGRLWLDRIGAGLQATEHTLTQAERETAIRILAHEAGQTVGANDPVLATLLPDSAARVQAILPPLVEAAVIAIRKRAERIYTLADYVDASIATKAQAQTLKAAVAERRNIVVAGGTGSGKTTLLNALLAEDAFKSARVVILEDTAELQCASPNQVALLTKRSAPAVTLRDLVKLTMRLRPDRIVVGEVRDGAALEVLKAWNTGHPGGLLTIHANSARDALMRLEDLALEASLHPPARLIAATIELVVFIARTNTGRRIGEILTFNGGGSVDVT
jgi:type IV secretion system protein VirB11